MSYFLVASLLVALLAILYVWYITRWRDAIPDTQPVPLETEDDKLLVHWYNMQLTHSYDSHPDDIAIAATFLQRIYNIQIDPGFLVIGTNLSDQYRNTSVETIYNTSQSNLDPVQRDYIFDIRSVLGKNGEIAIIHNPQIRNRLYQANNLDMSEINTIMSHELDLPARDYFREVLQHRWKQIRQLNDRNVLNSQQQEGSYLYLVAVEVVIDAALGTVPPDNTVIVFSPQNTGGVTATIAPNGARINLLCTDLEFETLMKRWTAHLVSRGHITVQ
jgi:hypothetical protein